MSPSRRIAKRTDQATVTLNLTPALLARARARAREEDTSVSALIRRLLRAELGDEREEG